MNILVGYNGSAVSKLALSEAKAYAKAVGGKVYIVTSMEGGSGETPEDISSAESSLEHARKSVADDGVECEAHQLARGLSPGEDLVKFVRDYSIDHLFVGIEKKSKTRKLLLGSTAQYVILKATCPVTTVK